jgi:hypothetical protein
MYKVGNRQMHAMQSLTLKESAHPYPYGPLPDETRMMAIWEREAVPGATFRADDGTRIVIHSIGRRNSHDGPDYLDALLTIDGATVAGAVELHVDERSWQRHGHDGDRRYRAVVLHVAMYRRGPRVTPAGIALLILSEQFLQPYRTALRSVLDAPADPSAMLCTDQIRQIPAGIIAAMLSVTAGERFNAKRERIARRLAELRENGHEEPHIQLFHELLLRALGYGGNQDDFEVLARILPHRQLMALAGGSSLDRYALLCGVANLSRRDVVSAMKPALRRRTAEALSCMFQAWTATGISSREFQWNSSGVRPGNRILPRLAWYAGFAPQLADRRWWKEIFNRLLNPNPQRMHAYDRMLVHLRGDECFGMPRPGLDRCREICINVIAPFAAVMAEDSGRGDIGRAAVNLYHSLIPAPENRVTRRLAPQLGLKAPLSSVEQQGLLELEARYCSPLHCLECLIGKACAAAR